jgi:pyrroloquinoline quinone biosynthesis protein E
VSAERPYTLVAELTYRCPLQCVYCSNPVELARHKSEIDAATWTRVLAEAEELGVVQVNLTGGEPLLRNDLEEIARAARHHQLYTNLITSGVPLSRERLAALQEAGIDAVQLSLQDTTPELSERIAGVDRLAEKLETARFITELALPLTLNVVLHRENLDRVGEFIDMAERMGAHRVELANTQYMGWALANRARLLPTKEQLDRARAVALRARDRLRGKMEILFVLPDYYSDFPKACMDGWARRFIVVAPDGLALPCHGAHTLPGLDLPNVRERSLAYAWNDSEAFRRFRGDAWMPEPCKSCDKRHVDFGGCRCQAFHLAGDAAVTDPACRLSPHHGIVREARREAEAASAAPYRYRTLRVLP